MNSLWEKIPHHDFTICVKQQKFLEREQSLKWQSMIEQYQKKLKILKTKQKIQFPNEMINYLYREQCTQANNSYEKDLLQLQIRKENLKHKKIVANIKEEIQAEIMNYDALEGSLLPLQPMLLERQTSLILGSYSDFVLALVIDVKGKFIISVQSFNLQYKSFYFDVEKVQSLAVSDIIQNNFYCVYSNGHLLNVVELQNGQQEIKKNELFSLKVKHNIDKIHIIDQNNIIIINQCQGRVSIIQNQLEKKIYKSKEVIKESKFINQELILLQNESIQIITNLANDISFKTIKVENYSSIIYFLANLPDFHIEFVRFSELVEDYIIFITNENKIQGYDIHKKQYTLSQLPTQVNIMFSAYLVGNKSLVFCDENGQTYFIEKLMNYFNQ